MSEFELLEIQEGDFTEKDREELADLLKNPSLRRALREVIKETNERSQTLLNLNLYKPEGIEKAKETQAYVRGMRRVVDALFELKEKANG